MDLWKSLAGMVKAELLCADSALALVQITEAGIPIYQIQERKDGFGLVLMLRRSDYRKLTTLAGKRGYEIKFISRGGLYWTGKALLRRPVLMVGMLLFFFLSLYLPSRVLFFQVEGNTLIPTNRILQECQNAGIGFGSSRREVRSEKVKNALLESIHELKWVGVNTSGCVATITVQERMEEPEPEGNQVSSIVAARDGIITSCTAAKGNLVCKVGQAVTAGEVLISGYTDCGLSIRATRSQGEIYAQTNREITVVTPNDFVSFGEIQEETKKYALIIGKKRINFYNCSGISGDSCDKMYSEYVLTLPGGFQLPVVLVIETWIVRQRNTEMDTAEYGAAMLAQAARDYLRSVMVAGTVLQETSQLKQAEDSFTLQSKFICHEMIGQVRDEEIIKPYGN